MTTPSTSIPVPANLDPAPARAVQAGLVFGLLAYGWWGVVTPWYFYCLSAVPPEILLGHRVIWGLPCLFLLLTLRSRWPAFRGAWRGGTLRLLLLSTLVISINWFFFIYAIVTKRAIDASLGYYINPLVSVALGMIVLRERLRAAQWVAVVIAAIGVAWYTASFGTLPWISLTLAFSFGLYGLLRKRAAVDAPVGLAFEMTIIAPLALTYFAINVGDGGAAFGSSLREGLLLTLAGPITVVPLLFFIAAARRLRLVTVGFLQYLAPSAQLLMALFVFGETLNEGMWVTMSLTWLALAVFSIDSALAQRAARRRTIAIPR